MAYDHRAEVYRDMGRLDEAIADLTEAINLKPTTETLYRRRAELYDRKGDTERAEENRKMAAKGDDFADLKAAIESFWNVGRSRKKAERRIPQHLVQDFVRRQRSKWNHQDWLNFLATVRSAGYHDLSDDETGLLLEEEKANMFGGGD